ncbi:50S ribosomal protein L23 [Anaplasmataceae bacterium AB001_6]|nr:50S ribosomal protein L23 [Anaplasmataceae bacterium AB001_6]
MKSVVNFIDKIVLSEKSENAAKLGHFVFYSSCQRFSKNDVKNSLRLICPNISVKSIKSANYKGKAKNFRMSRGFRKDRKKFVVVLNSSDFSFLKKELEG